MEFTSDGYLILTKLEVFVYTITSNRIEKANYWALREPVWSGSLILLASNTDCVIRLQDECGVIFGVANIDLYPGNNLMPVTDSTRYFALRLSNQFYGIGFSTGEDSALFITSIGDYLLKLRDMKYIADPDEIEIIDEIAPDVGGTESRIPRDRRKARLNWEDHSIPESSSFGHAQSATEKTSEHKLSAGDRLLFNSILPKTVKENKTCPTCEIHFITFEGLRQHYIHKHGLLEFFSEHASNRAGTGFYNVYSRLNFEEPTRVLRSVDTPIHAHCQNNKTRQNLWGRGRFKKNKSRTVFSPMHFVNTLMGISNTVRAKEICVRPKP
ncbi:unnamed protein product [Allacma fusca]|uniref:NECAP PHear domain-containing protein n=1 Tax=Allacma fusca TaxID=39272 RepID=A0A8J2JBF3_9HEXA|nr:unnamed protein product [Allacma fusca]